ncbi:MAG: hypothetical protein HOW97_08670 [Catenulispora sp.]|nr:hypothetical protein [Catenulispora sp.]
MEQREELEIETRLRAALAARSELVTHSTLRPGIPPNEHTAGLKTQRAGLWSWRRFLVPVTVAAALGGGVFVGSQLSDKSGSQANGAAAGGYPPRVTSSTGAPSTEATQPSAQGVPNVAVAEGSVGALRFTVADGWQVTALDATSACVAPKAAAAPGGASGTPSGSASANSSAKSGTLPCGLDALYLKSDAAADAWPRSTATKATGWWPKAVDAPSQIVCPAAKHDTSNHVTDSVSLRSSAKYVLGGGAAAAGATPGAPVTAEYHEWAVTCDEGAGVKPMLWELLPAGGAAGGGKTAVAAVVSSDPAYDTALLGMVGSLHLAG